MRQTTIFRSRAQALPKTKRQVAAVAAIGALVLCVTSASFAAGDDQDDGHGAHGLEVNWIHGVLGESDEIDEPSLLWRKPGMPVPLAAQVFNSLILFYVLYHFGKKAVVDGLASRREGIMRGIEAASKMKAEAKEQLAGYEAKLQKVDSEIERVRREMREAAEAEQKHILEEAKKRRERMERDAKLLISQELKAAREQLLQDTIGIAIAGAEQLVRQKVDSADHQRLSDEYLSALQGSIRSGGIVRAQRSGGTV